MRRAEGMEDGGGRPTEGSFEVAGMCIKVEAHLRRLRNAQKKGLGRAAGKSHRERQGGSQRLPEGCLRAPREGVDFDQ
eukprot:6596220-Pyramimonas_sp.AAC.1